MRRVAGYDQLKIILACQGVIKANDWAIVFYGGVCPRFLPGSQLNAEDGGRKTRRRCWSAVFPIALPHRVRGGELRRSIFGTQPFWLRVHGVQTMPRLNPARLAPLRTVTVDRDEYEGLRHGGDEAFYDGATLTSPELLARLLAALLAAGVPVEAWYRPQDCSLNDLALAPREGYELFKICI